MWHSIGSFPFLRSRLGMLLSLSLTFVFVTSVALDQISKRHAHAVLLNWQHDSDIKMYRSKMFEIGTIGEEATTASDTDFYVRLKFQYQRNTGAAFSMFADLDDGFRVPFFYAVTLIAILFISYYLKTLPMNFYLTRFGLVMILSGAIGNFIDRILLGYVIDFIDVDWVILGWRHDFAVFNIADIAINIGIIAFLLEALLPVKPLMSDGTLGYPKK